MSPYEYGKKTSRGAGTHRQTLRTGSKTEVRRRPAPDPQTERSGARAHQLKGGEPGHTSPVLRWEPDTMPRSRGHRCSFNCSTGTDTVPVQKVLLRSNGWRAARCPLARAWGFIDLDSRLPLAAAPFSGHRIIPRTAYLASLANTPYLPTVGKVGPVVTWTDRPGPVHRVHARPDSPVSARRPIRIPPRGAVVRSIGVESV